MKSDSSPSRVSDLRQKLSDLNAEIAKIEDELAVLESDAQLDLADPSPPAQQEPPRTPAEKIALFLDLFGTRRSVYPQRWENGKSGKSGYSPVCNNEWRPGICYKPKVKCAECAHQRFPPLDESAVEAHLRGRKTLGVYAIAADDTCRFLAADFDGEGWQDNVLVYGDAAERLGITVAIERSRSGHGAHAWIFFAAPVPAAAARRLGLTLVAKASGLRPTLGLEAYDRLFPNQDTLPVGGFGNLIALPLAMESRKRANAVFVNTNLEPFEDQWSYLAQVPRLAPHQLDRILARVAPLAPCSPPVSPAFALEQDAMLQTDENLLDLSEPRIRPKMLSGEITIRLDAQIHVPRSLPAAVLAGLRRLATFPNPIFHEKLRLRFPTFNTPRFLFAGEWHPDRLMLPRGVLEPCLALLERAGATVVVQEARESGTRIPWRFQGTLRSEQATAVRQLLAFDHGVLCAPPGAGKTVMGCAMIARARTSVLVLVHRTVLLDQWRQTAMTFLGLKRKEIGVRRGRTSRLTGRLDIAMLPSLGRAEDPASFLSGYGLVIIDECHHVPAASFEAVLKLCPSRLLYGLTATPKRKDRLEPLLYAQCGPIRHTLETPGSAEGRVVNVRHTHFVLPPEVGPHPPIHVVWEALVQDTSRIATIVDDVRWCLDHARSPLVLSDRKLYLDRLATALIEQAPGTVCFRLDGQTGIKARREILSKLSEHYKSRAPFALFATASLIGEGFDLPELDTLILSMPLSFKGRLIQYAGRLHRPHDRKHDALIFDYLDANHPITSAMFRRRLGGYKELGYRIDMPTVDSALFDRLAANATSAGSSSYP